MRKLLILGSIAAATIAAAPAKGQDNRRQEVRTACAESAPAAPAAQCGERRQTYRWFYRGYDEGQPPRRVVRRFALDG